MLMLNWYWYRYWSTVDIHTDYLCWYCWMGLPCSSWRSLRSSSPTPVSSLSSHASIATDGGQRKTDLIDDNDLMIFNSSSRRTRVAKCFCSKQMFCKLFPLCLMEGMMVDTACPAWTLPLLSSTTWDTVWPLATEAWSSLKTRRIIQSHFVAFPPWGSRYAS